MMLAQKASGHRHRRSEEEGPIFHSDDFKFQFGICYKIGIPCTGSKSIYYMFVNKIISLVLMTIFNILLYVEFFSRKKTEDSNHSEATSPYKFISARHSSPSTNSESISGDDPWI